VTPEVPRNGQLFRSFDLGEGHWALLGVGTVLPAGPRASDGLTIWRPTVRLADRSHPGLPVRRFSVVEAAAAVPQAVLSDLLDACAQMRWISAHQLHTLEGQPDSVVRRLTAMHDAFDQDLNGALRLLRPARIGQPDRPPSDWVAARMSRAGSMPPVRSISPRAWLPATRAQEPGLG
jgi:hypothetical protein